MENHECGRERMRCHSEQEGSGPVGQYHSLLLPQQAGRNGLTQALQGSDDFLEMGHGQQRPSQGRSHCRGAQHRGRHAEQSVSASTRVVPQQGLPPPSLSHMGYTTHRPLRHGPQQAGPAVLLPGQNWRSLARGCLSDSLVPRALLCLPALPAHAQGPLQGQGLQHPLYPDCPTVASPGLVPSLTLPFTGTMPSAATCPGPINQGRDQAPQCGSSESSCLAPVRSGVGLSLEVLKVILNARKLSTRLSYQRKWSRFSRWLAPKGVSPFDCPFPIVLDYLLDLCSQGLAFSSIKVHMAAISAFHEQIDGKTVFTHWLCKQFLKGLFKTFPPRAPPIPQWSLSLVLSQLMLRPFEPLSTCPLPLQGSLSGGSHVL
ncbi:NAD-dependent protein deacylase sirtuin-5, mitochondrial isoform X1 [Eublepharis macularius]|uniref:NAD-dependent protein deacylase sirtuin-5, mitochondrial isoform X1 n=1 Tax=Eublepharis macularius TaxID=481883 RepID=A0AA97JNJ1_EUBMA|nr:NAD-dependent protein deacylase sirtuin-5, mitochondrial isoform X1 [Eublepharis macularius]